MNKVCFKLAAAVVLLIASTGPADAHNGPPFPIIEGKHIGSCVVALWTHPDVGTGTFYVILDPPSGGTIPQDLKIEIGIRPVSGRLPEKLYTAQREDLRGQIHYSTAVYFDADEIWRVHLLMHSASCGGESYATVEATPPGLGRWDLLFFSTPFLGAGFLWFMSATRGRKRRKSMEARTTGFG